MIEDIEFHKFNEIIDILDKKLILGDLIPENFLSDLITQFDKVDFSGLDHYNELYELEYQRHTKLRYDLNFIHSLFDDLNELKKSINNITTLQEKLINNIHTKLIDIDVAVDMNIEEGERIGRL